MTQAEQVDIQHRMHEACARFYEAFDCVPERVLVYFAQKPHLAPFLTLAFRPHADAILTPSEFESLQCVTLRTAQVPIEAWTNSDLNWNEFLLYSTKAGWVSPEDLQPGPTLIKKIIEAKGYKVLVSPRGKADFFYIFNWERYIYWPVVRVEYAPFNLAYLKTQINLLLKELAD